jgi:hypothetical protein
MTMPFILQFESPERFVNIVVPKRGRGVMTCLAAPLLLLPSPVVAQALQPGAWDVTSTVVDLTIPGVPGFIQRMIKGKSKAEHKRLLSGQGIEALLAPDAKAQCHIDDQRIFDGHYAQALSCPQKKGDAMRIARVGTYDAKGFTGRATVSGATAKGPISIVLDQSARRKAG